MGYIHVKVVSQIWFFMVMKEYCNVIAVDIWVLTYNRIAAEVVYVIESIYGLSVLPDLYRKEVGVL